MMSNSWVIERSRKMGREDAITYLRELLQRETEKKRKLKAQVKWLSKVIHSLKKEIKRRKKENE